MATWCSASKISDTDGPTAPDCSGVLEMNRYDGRRLVVTVARTSWKVALLAILSVVVVRTTALGESETLRVSTGSLCESQVTTAAMRECELVRYRQADAGMIEAYEGLMGQLDETGKVKLRAAQQAWLRFRDAEADFQADAARGGTVALLIKVSVLADLTEFRRDQLLKEASQLRRRP